MTRPARHRWVKLRVHAYICRRCGCGRTNALESGKWIATFHTPDGVSAPREVTPSCEPGPRTAAYLAKHGFEQLLPKVAVGGAH